MYAAYNNVFFEAMKKGLLIQEVFDKLTDTAFWEKYMLNSFQFSAAKNRAEMKLLQQNVFDENKKIKPFNKFRDSSLNIVRNFSETWLRVEYDLAANGAVMAENWKQIWDNRDLFPYATYKTRDDNRVRDEHRALNNLRFKIDSPTAQNIYPPNGWNCRCYWDTSEEKGNLDSEEKIKKLKEENVNKEFQNNVGVNAIFPSKNHSYLDVLPNANKASHDMFGANSNERVILNTTIYNSSAIKETMAAWKDSNKDLIFRNRDWLLNVFMSKKILDKLNKKSRGFENIRSTIEHPHEIWMMWKDEEKQDDVITTYFSHDEKYSYIVETLKGEVFDSYFRSHNDSKILKKRGIKLIK